ncbi:hypothetical protein RZS08_25800, partial [Arthrospira platensis SPKY1]|nr:hypothetical protein [Arthrospira platensis SPKY1]
HDLGRPEREQLFNRRIVARAHHYTRLGCDIRQICEQTPGRGQVIVADHHQPRPLGRHRAQHIGIGRVRKKHRHPSRMGIPHPRRVHVERNIGHRFLREETGHVLPDAPVAADDHMVAQTFGQIAAHRRIAHHHRLREATA